MVSTEPNRPPMPPPTPQPGRLLWTILIVTCSIACVMAAIAVLSFILHDNPFAMLGGCLLLPAAAIAAWLQIGAVVRRNSTLAGLTSLAYWCAAGICLFALVSNALEAVTKRQWGDMSFWLVFGSICIALSLAFIIGARAFRRWERELEEFERSLTRCTKCGYDLRGNIAAKIRQCPECGTSIQSDAGKSK